MAEITLFIAFIAGVLSFTSPCILPLVPAFIAYMSGVSADHLRQRAKKPDAFVNSVLFVLGFSLVFSIMGVVINTAFSGIAGDARAWLGRIGGAAIILFGLHLAGVLKLPFLGRDRKIQVKAHHRYLTSFLFGVAFAAGWTPCIGAILGSILVIAITQPETSFYMLLAYSMGLGVPFILAGLFTEQATGLIARYGNLMKYFTIVSGTFLVAVGVLVFTGQLEAIANLALAADMLR